MSCCSSCYSFGEENRAQCKLELKPDVRNSSLPRRLFLMGALKFQFHNKTEDSDGDRRANCIICRISNFIVSVLLDRGEKILAAICHLMFACTDILAVNWGKLFRDSSLFSWFICLNESLSRVLIWRKIKYSVLSKNAFWWNRLQKNSTNTFYQFH